MRKGKEFYSKKYNKAIELNKNGKNVKEIAAELDISYSAVYHWVKKLRKPMSGNLSDFENFVKKSPVAVAEIKEKFPKHNELFLTSTKRGIPIKRYFLKRKYGDYSTWYFFEGQENELKKRLQELFKKYKKLLIEWKMI